MDIGTGRPEDHQTPLPLDASGLPAVAGVTPRTPVASGPADAGPLGTPERDTTGERLAQLAAGEADAAAAMHAAMTAEDDRRAHYAADVTPLGASYGDLMTLPPTPEYTLPPPPVGGYPFSGDEPIDAA